MVNMTEIRKIREIIGFSGSNRVGKIQSSDLPRSLVESGGRKRWSSKAVVESSRCWTTFGPTWNIKGHFYIGYFRFRKRSKNFKFVVRQSQYLNQITMNSQMEIPTPLADQTFFNINRIAIIRPSCAEGTGLKGVFKYLKVAKNEPFKLYNWLRIIEKHIMIQKKL